MKVFKVLRTNRNYIMIRCHLVKIYLLLALVAIVLIAGCTGTQTATNPNAGMVINSFSATPTNVLEGDRVLFEAEIQNAGGTTGRNVVVELFGVEETWRTSDGDPVDSTLVQEYGRLDPARPERNLPGDIRIPQR